MQEKILLEAPLWLDREFILSTDFNALYCTTLLEFLLSPHITLNAQYEEIDFPAFQGKYLFPKAFYEDFRILCLFMKISIRISSFHKRQVSYLLAHTFYLCFLAYDLSHQES